MSKATDRLAEFNADEKQAAASLMAETASYHLAFIAEALKSQKIRTDLSDDGVAQICVIDDIAKQIVDKLGFAY